MIHAYSEIYLDDAMNTLAEVFSYTPDARQADVLFQRFVMSGIAYQFGKGFTVTLLVQAVINMHVPAGKLTR